MDRDISIDFLKVVATNLIVCHHFQQALEVRWQYPFINFYGGRFYFGYLVELFFIISGMCAARWIKDMGETITFPEYIYKRAKRLLPISICSVIVFSILKIAYFITRHVWLYDIEFNMWGGVSACLGIQAGWATSNPMLNNPIWYISVLLLCYILMYFVTWLSKKWKINKYYFYIGIIFAGMGIETYNIKLPFLNGYSSRGYMAFFWGIIFNRLWKYIDVKQRWIQLLSWFMFISVIISVVCGYDSEMKFNVVFILWPAVIIICHSRGFSKIICQEFWSGWAKVSFDIYIWHRILLTLYLFIPIENRSWLMSIEGMLLTLCFMQVIGVLSHYFIELPLEQRLEKLSISLKAYNF